MIKAISALLFSLLILNADISAQNKNPEKYGNTLNLGIGLGGYAGHYGYIGNILPVLHANYEFDVANSFTLAPFISMYSYSKSHYWGDKNHPNRYYTYRQTVVPIGVKGTYYFDKILNAGSSWDFYLSGSLGYTIVNSRWENGYYGDKKYFHYPNALFLDGHVGAEYHINNKVGIFLDLSTGVSTAGLSIKL